jgi:Zn-dependent protease with chaperone function
MDNMTMRFVFSSLVTLGLLSGLVFGGIMAVMVYLNVVDMWISMGITTLISVVGFFISPIIMDWKLRVFNGVEWWDSALLQARQPELYNLMMKICQEHGMNMPDFGMIDDQNPTAFCYGTFRNNSRVVMTQGIFTYLTIPQAKAVLAHEMGHICNRDFAVMTAASIMVQLLYQMYASLAKMAQKKESGGGKDKDKGGAAIVAVGLYVAYIVGIYLLLYLSRCREYMADTFAARYTSAADLAGALVRIGYGILDVGDTDKSQHLLMSTRTLGIVDVQKAGQLAMLGANDSLSVSMVSESMVFDVYNPWASLCELGSTHPLIGRRLEWLFALAQQLGQNFPDLDVHKAAARMNLDKARLWRNFVGDMLVCLAPLVLACVLYEVALFLPVYMDYQPIMGAGVGFVIGSLLVSLYSLSLAYPEPTAVRDLITDPYASPMRGRPVRMEGVVVGRLDPGNFVNEDMMFKDTSGLVPLDFQSWLGMLGNLFAGWKRVKLMIGQDAALTGWYFRGAAGMVLIDQIHAGGTTLKARPYVALLGRTALMLALVGGVGAMLMENYASHEKEIQRATHERTQEKIIMETYREMHPGS